MKEKFGQGDWPELDSMSLRDLTEVSYDGYELGRLMEVPVKWFLLAETLTEDPLASQTYRKFLRSARKVLGALEHQFQIDPPDQVVLLNGLFMFEALIWEVCRRHRIPVISYERGFIVDSFVFAHDRVASYFEMNEVWDRIRKVPLSKEQSVELDMYMADRRSGRRTSDDYWSHVVEGALGRTRPGRRAVLFSNLVWDSAVLGQNVAFPSIVDWVEATIRIFEQHPNDELIVRIHPAETKLSGRESRERLLDSLMRRIPRVPDNVLIIPSEEDVSSYDLMAEADFGLVYSSTAGLEMAIAGKPVIVAARTHYRDKGFTIDVSSKDEFFAAVERELSQPSSGNADLAARYAHLFFFRNPYFGMGVEEPMRGLVRFTATTMGDLQVGGRGDVARFIASVRSGATFDAVQ